MVAASTLRSLRPPSTTQKLLRQGIDMANSTDITIKIKNTDNIDIYAYVYDLGQGPGKLAFKGPIVVGQLSGLVPVLEDPNEPGAYQVHWVAQDPTGKRQDGRDSLYVKSGDQVAVKTTSP